MYEKELDLRLSRSYGPGRYDRDYGRGRDLPPGYVRWTERQICRRSSSSWRQAGWIRRR